MGSTTGKEVIRVEDAGTGMRVLHMRYIHGGLIVHRMVRTPFFTQEYPPFIGVEHDW